MLRNIANRSKWNYGAVGAVVNYRKYRLGNANIFALNHCLLSEQRSWILNDRRNYSTRQPPVETSTASSTILPKINALISDSNKLAPVSRNIINNSKSLFRRQWEAFFNWYDEISHTNEVREAHKQVEDLQDKLNQAQELRRDVSKQLNDIRYELQTCFADQANCPKGDPRYLELIRREIEVSECFFPALNFFYNFNYISLDIQQREAKE